MAETTEHEDLLLKHIELTPEQENFLSSHMSENRPVLFKEFRQRFNLLINKVQFNLVLMNLKEKQQAEFFLQRRSKYAMRFKMPDVEKERNVYWLKNQGVWDVKFKVNGKSIRIGIFKPDDYDKAVKLARECRDMQKKGQAAFEEFVRSKEKRKKR